MEPRCEICTIINTDNDDVVLLNAQGWRVVLMENQGVLGAMYLTTVKHYHSLGELTDSEWLGLRNLTRELESAVSRAFHPVYFNFACDMNDAARDKQPTHVYFKLRPRYANALQVNDEVFSDTGFGSKRIEPHVVAKDTLLEIKRVILSKLDAGGLKIQR